MNKPITLPSELEYAPLEALDGAAVRSPAFGLRRFVATLRRSWWVLALSLGLALGAGVWCALRVPPTYVSAARMWETEKLQLPEGATFTEDPQNYLGTQTELLRSPKLQQLALARLQAAGGKSVPTGKDGKPLPVKLKVSQVPRSTIFAVEARSSDPGYTREYLDALLSEYIDYKRNVRKVVSGDTLASISEQVLRLETELKGYQDALTSFQRSNNLAVLQDEGTIAGSYLAKLRTQLSDYKLEAQLLEATAIEKASATPGWTGGTATGTPGGEPPSAAQTALEHQTVLKEVQVLKAQRAQFSRYLKPRHPRMIKLEGDIERGEKVIELFRDQTREQLVAARKATQLKIESVVASIQEWQSRVVEANARIAEAERLKLNVSRTQSLYDRLVLLLQNVDISRNIEQATLAVLEPASVAERSLREQLLVLGLAVFAGLALGLGWVGVVTLRDDRFSSAAELAMLMEARLLGQVPDLGRHPRHGVQPLLGHDDAPNSYAEAYRTLRSALRFWGPVASRPKVLLVTSALPEEGKSTIAANLARVLALGGSRVLLIDGDLRRGQLHTMLGLKGNRGLGDWLLKSKARSNLIQTNSLANWAFLARGRELPNPGDSFLSAQFDRLLARWRKGYDYVLIDSSPILVNDDSTTLAPKVDGTLMVVRCRSSSAQAVREALELLEQRQARVLGLILNRAEAAVRMYQAANTVKASQATKPAQGKAAQNGESSRPGRPKKAG